MKNRQQIYIAMGCVVRGTDILLIRRHEPNLPEIHGKWELPGGKIEFNEDPASACEREIYEETGAVVQARRLLPRPYSTIRRTRGREIHVVLLGFLCELKSFALPRTLPGKISEIRWIPFSQLDPDEVGTGTLSLLARATEEDAASTLEGLLRLKRVA